MLMLILSCFYMRMSKVSLGISLCVLGCGETHSLQMAHEQKKCLLQGTISSTDNACPEFERIICTSNPSLGWR